jgi:redox-sensitive bicupin YhaK (pirin superfamily)
MCDQTVRLPFGVRAAVRVQEGIGMMLRRALPDTTLQAIGPVILLDHLGPAVVPHGVENGVPPHPHAGMEALTYVLAGSGSHRDSAGNASIATAGEVQWMRAGRGIVHAESITGDCAATGSTVHMVHIWINLPRGHKHCAPDYRAFCAADIPTLRLGAARVHLLAGDLGGRRGPVETFADPFIGHLAFDDGGVAEVPVEAAELGLYVTEGRLRVDGGALLVPGNIVLFGPGDHIRLEAEGQAGAMLIGGQPLDAPLVRHGPFVMNTHAEIQSALRDYLAGRMGILAPVVPAEESRRLDPISR